MTYKNGDVEVKVAPHMSPRGLLRGSECLALRPIFLAPELASWRLFCRHHIYLTAFCHSSCQHSGIVSSTFVPADVQKRKAFRNYRYRFPLVRRRQTKAKGLKGERDVHLQSHLLLTNIITTTPLHLQQRHTYIYRGF